MSMSAKMNPGQEVDPREKREEIILELLPWMFNNLVDGALSERDDGSIIIFEGNDVNVPERPMEAEDIKLTTKWADNNEMMHYAAPSGGRSTIKLGVKWDYMEYKSDEQFVLFLLHEITHSVAQHHRIGFWEKETKYFERLLENKDKIEEIYPEFNWDDFCAYFVNDPYDNLKSEPEFRSQVISMFEETANYQFDWYLSIFVNPPRYGFKDSWNEDDEVEYVSIDELDVMDCDDGVVHGVILAERSKGISDFARIPEIKVSENGGIFFGGIWVKFLERIGENEVPVKVI